jgi:integrase
MHLSQAVSQFIAWREAEGFSTRTAELNKAHLYRIIEIIGDIQVQDFNATAFDKVMSNESRRGLSPNSLNAIQSTTMAFTKWAHARDVMPPLVSPVSGRRYRKVPPKDKTMLALSQFPVILNAAPNPRDRILIAIALYTMARQSELVTLRIKDVDLESGYVYMRIHKANKDDKMPISAELDAELRTWFKIYAEECGPLQGDWYLIPARKKASFDTMELCPKKMISKSQPIVQRALKNMGITPKYYQDGMHLLRRSSARRLYDELVSMGYDGAMRQVQTWLHHESVLTTEKYLGLTVDRDTRDKSVRGNPMFPSLKADNVVELEAIRGARNATEL